MEGLEHHGWEMGLDLEGKAGTASGMINKKINEGLTHSPLQSHSHL